MKLNRRHECIGVFCLAIFVGLIYGCAPTSVTTESDPPAPVGKMTESGEPSAAKQYAAEVLSYMIQVTLGKAGNPGLRGEWATRGLELPLDFKTISDLMLGPNKEPSRVMVLDNNILGLSQVLYHYDQRLNLFKGQRSQNSLFPSKELICMRVMLLQKISRDEKVSMSALMERKSQILDAQMPAEAIDLGNTGLTLSEMKMLKDIIQSDPSFMTYLENPFIIDTLYRIGAIRLEPYVRTKIEQANYKDVQWGNPESKLSDQVVSVSIVPSILANFQHTNIDPQKYPNGMMPAEDYNQAIEKLLAKMREFLQKLIQAKMFTDSTADDTADQEGRIQQVNDFIKTHVKIEHLNQRPLAVYPENADKVLQHIETDFNIIVLGKNVYLSLHISDVDAFPHANRVYLDIIDIKHAQVDYEISQISMFIFNKLIDRIP